MLGPSKRDGGIQMIHPTRDARIVVAHMIEGWQFTINAFAEYDNEDEIKALCPDSVIGDTFFLPYSIPDDIDVIRVVPKEVNGIMTTPYLYFGTNVMCVLKKEVAKKNLRRFTNMNRLAWQKHVIEANPTPTISESAVIARLRPISNN